MRIPPLQRGGERPGALLAFAAMLIVLAILHVAVFDRTADFDDAYFADALDRQSLGDFLLDRYLHWSGRLPIDALAALLLDHLWVWRIVNAAMVLWLCASAARLGFGERLSPALRASCAFALLWCMPTPVLREAAWWVSGSFNYLWPTAAGLAAMAALFDRRERGPWTWAGLSIAGGFAAYHEQVALAMLAIGVPRVLWLWHTKRLVRGEVALLVSIIVNALVNFGAPGVQARYEAEIPRHFPGFADLGVFDKTMLGIEAVMKLARSSNVLFVFAVAAVGAVAVRIAWTRKANVARLSEQGRREAAWLGWSVLVGLGTLAAMGFSPTVHGSGSRTAFVACTVLLVATCRMLSSVRERFGARAFAWPMGIAACVAAVRVLETALKHA